MKHTLLFFLVMLNLIPATARHYELGCGIGLTWNNRWSGQYQPIGARIASIMLLRQIHPKVQVGLRSEISGFLANRYMTGPGSSQPELIAQYNDRIADPLYTWSFLMNYQQEFCRLRLYGGLAVGYSLAVTPEVYDGEPNAHGPIFGGQLGAVYSLSKRWGLSVDFAPRYYKFQWYFRGLYHGVWSYPVSVGLRLKV